MEHTQWYKNFWPWVLIFFPLITIVLCISLYITAIGNGPDMVVDDYYKKGRAINLELVKFDKAKALYLHGNLDVSDDRVSFEFTKGDNSNVSALKLSFYHRTIKAHDFKATLTPNASGTFTALLENYTPGVYSVFIEPIDESWKMKENVTLPTTTSILVTPNYK